MIGGIKLFYSILFYSILFYSILFYSILFYSIDVRRENLTFWLFQKYVKSDLMSNNMKMNGDMRN